MSGGGSSGGVASLTSIALEVLAVVIAATALTDGVVDALVAASAVAGLHLLL